MHYKFEVLGFPWKESWTITANLPVLKREADGVPLEFPILFPFSEGRHRETLALKAELVFLFKSSICDAGAAAMVVS